MLPELSPWTMGDSADRTEPEAPQQTRSPWLRWINRNSPTIGGLTRQQLTRFLSPQEKITLQQLHRMEDQDRHLVGRAVLRVILGSMLQREPSSLKLTTNQYGKPSLELPEDTHAPYFNLSYSGNLILIGIHDKNPIGVDIERIRSIPEREELATQYFGRDEAERLRQAPRDQQDRYFLQRWCRLESQLKATGRGFAEHQDRTDPNQTCTHTWDLPLPKAFCGATSILL